MGLRCVRETGDYTAVVITTLSCVLGSLYRDWRCLAEHVGLQVTSLQDISCEKRLTIILEEWGRKETVTVAKVHQVLMRSQCTRAAGCLGSAALLQRMMSQEDGILDLEEEPHLEQFC